MATRSRTAVGSTPWIVAEQENVVQLLQQEKEELIYPAQHAMEWLNEHMTEIFAKSQFNVAEVFKTPGKLRGKTPRTGRKRNVLEPRMPLSDVFSSKPNAGLSPTRSSKTDRPAASFDIAKDDEEEKQIRCKTALPKQYTDSGYHGSTGDEMEIDSTAPLLNTRSGEPAATQDKTMVDLVDSAAAPASMERRTTEGSFHSANENVASKASFAEPQDDDGMQRDDVEADTYAASPLSPAPSPEADLQHDRKSEDGEAIKRPNLMQELDEIGSPSDGSTPDHPLVRKSSLTFASLPPREPLNSKRSFGARESRTGHLDHFRNGRSSYFAKRTTGTHPLSIESQGDLHADQTMTDVDEHKEEHSIHNNGVVDSLTNNKSSTQTLHEKIDMLGKSHASRPSKSIPPAAALAASNLRKSEAVGKAAKEASVVQTTTRNRDDDDDDDDNDDDDWIKPLETPEGASGPVQTASTAVMDQDTYDDSADEMEWDMRAPELIAHEERMRTPIQVSPSPGKMPPVLGHTKSASTATLASPTKADMETQHRHAKPISVSNPPYSSTTPQGSPRRLLDVPLSASKSKLQSIMKTAKSLFTSSAGVSAAAKMETLSSDTLETAANNVPNSYPDLTGVMEDKPLPPFPTAVTRQTRSSTEREKEEKGKERGVRDRQQAEEQLEVGREQEQRIAAQYKAHERTAQGQPRPTKTLRKSPRRLFEERMGVEIPTEISEMPPPAAPAIQGKAQRPAKPTREPPKRNRPQMSIRVGSTLSHRMPVTNSSLASTLQDTLPPTNVKQAVVNKKASNASLSSAPSNATIKSLGTTQGGKPKALLAAERKREVDEREAQRKLEQKREAERKRAAMQEEARRQEQRQRAEAERKERERVAAEQAKKNAQQQAIERRRQEQARKLEEQRAINAGNDIAGPSARHRGEVGASRAPSRMGATSTLDKSLTGHHLPTNPAKPPKRPHEDEGGPSRAQGLRHGAALPTQQPEAKRRRTEDEGCSEAPSRPTISGAPIRQSNMGKKPSIYPHGYAPAPNGPLANQSQYQLHPAAQPLNPPHRIAHPSEIAKFANGNKIPFADAPNPPATYPSHHLAHKTPASSSSLQTKQLPQLPSKSTLQLVKSSPQPPVQGQAYTPGETISLPEIPTDSDDDNDDDDDSESGGANGFPAPSWVSPTTLTNQLIAQESNIDGDAVFGPIAPLKMEEIFNNGKGSNKDRLKKFRDRTSSANWVMSGDGLTMEEVRLDREMRERMRLQGGWRYGN